VHAAAAFGPTLYTLRKSLALSKLAAAATEHSTRGLHVLDAALCAAGECSPLLAAAEVWQLHADGT
jgi:hypothetical protein